MSVFKRKDRRTGKESRAFWCRFNFNGRTIFKSTRTANRRDAENAEAIWRAQLARGDLGIPDQAATPTLQQLGKQFLDYLPGQVAKRTVGFYTDAWAPLVAYKPLAGAKLNQTDTNLINRVVEHRRAVVSVTSLNHSLRTLRHALHLAKEWKLLPTVPKIKLLPNEHRREFVLTEDVLRKFVADGNESFGRLLTFLVDTGLRISEACELKWEDVNLPEPDQPERGWIHVTGQDRERPPLRASYRSGGRCPSDPLQVHPSVPVQP